MRRDSAMTRFFNELPSIVCIATLLGCFYFTLFHVSTYFLTPEHPTVKEFSRRLKTEGPESAQQFLREGLPPDSLDYYEVLDIPRFSPIETVKKAYREKLTIYHPDKFEGDEEEANMKTHRAREAYQVLTSKDRCMYDFGLGSGIRRFADCNQVWIDREAETFNEKRKEAKERREAQKKNPAGRQEKPQEQESVQEQEKPQRQETETRGKPVATGTNDVAGPVVTSGQKLVQKVKDIGVAAKTAVLFVVGWIVVHFGRGTPIRFR
ncbi:DnaJ-domain-containing protein [Daldinia decipiens]|uniref:DnaJ-domain-containing protein n=1 Tax=Daldinia decipiens TaxID=326647 RepID=UPI0020C50D99|nr:DnaJ-domain-containing protein [Daldinia decipiens]KAI1660380.1 DnaJ-domain-containing protein [Daldinia decipiens]